MKDPPPDTNDFQITKRHRRRSPVAEAGGGGGGAFPHLSSSSSSSSSTSVLLEDARKRPRFHVGHHRTGHRTARNTAFLILSVATASVATTLLFLSPHTTTTTTTTTTATTANLRAPHRHLTTPLITCPPTPSPTEPLPPILQFTAIPVLILLSAFFSGLTLSMMGLDTIQLEIVMGGDDEELAKAAGVILPVRRKSNLLLCTLLLGNVAVNTLLGILMAELTSGTTGFLVSTVLIVIFGEILPQALFSRYALQVGKRAVPMVKAIIVLLYIIAKPLAYLLDRMLGHELGTTYSKAEMSKLLEIHVKEGRFSEETGIAMAGALKYQDVSVKDVMTPLENTFMISVDSRLNFDTMSKIFKTGYSRIPVFEGGNVQNVIGLLFTKDLIFIDPDDETPVKNFCQIFGRAPHLVWPDDKLGDVLRYLKKGHTHMALVRGTNTLTSPDLDPSYELFGIVTLEDIIEEIIGEEILDETDAWVDGEHSRRVDRAKGGFDWASLRLLDAKIVDQTLSEEEVKAVAAHLRTNHSKSVASLSDRQLPRMIAATPVIELPSAQETREVGESLPTGSANLLYEKNAPSDVCTLILGGKVTVVAGIDNFRSDVSSWTVLGAGALEEEGYTPDFSAYVSGSGPCRCLRFTRKIFAAAVEASGLETVAVPKSVVPMVKEEEEEDVGGGLRVSIHDQLSAGALDATEEVRGRRTVLLEVLLKKGSPAVAETEHVQGTAGGAEVELELATLVSGDSLGADNADSLDRKEGEGDGRGIGGLEEVTHEFHN